MDRLTDVSFVKVLFENGLIDFNNIFSWDVLIAMIRPSHGYRLVIEMSLSKRCFDNLDTPLTRV